MALNDKSFLFCFLKSDFSAETAGTEKGEVLCALGEMDPSVRGTQKVMPPSNLITPKSCPPFHHIHVFMTKLLHKLYHSLYMTLKLPKIQEPIHCFAS